MAITNPEAIVYVNEVVRPLAEKFRDLKAEVDVALVEWHNTISQNVANDAGESLDDGRDAEGVSRLTGADINSFMARVQDFQTDMNVAGVANVIEKPTVRRLRLTERSV